MLYFYLRLNIYTYEIENTVKNPNISTLYRTSVSTCAIYLVEVVSYEH